MADIGKISFPDDFKYREAFLKGRPRHEKTDPFRIRHPAMETGRRAKIFAPFDALRGFRGALRDAEEKSREDDPLSPPSASQ